MLVWSSAVAPGGLSSTLSTATFTWSTKSLPPAFVNERDWLERLVEEILGSVPTALSVVLSGSWAKRKAKSESGVDLLLIVRPNHKSRGPEVHERIDETRGKMTGRFGRP